MGQKILLSLIPMLLKLLQPFLQKLIDLAYEKIEEWARGEEAKGVSVSSEEKMQRAIAVIQAQQVAAGKRPTDAAILRQYLETVHVKKQRTAGKTAGAR